MVRPGQGLEYFGRYLDGWTRNREVSPWHGRRLRVQQRATTGGGSARGRSDIISHLVTSMSQYEDLVPLAHGAASAVADVIGAASAHVTLIVDDQFCDLVNVGDLDKDMVTFPTRQYYPLASYPAATACLLSHRGYLSSEGWDGPDGPDGSAALRDLPWCAST